MKTYVFQILCVLAVAGAAVGVEYDFETGTQAWTASPESTGVANFAASGGYLGLDYITPTGPFDPQIVSPWISMDASRDHWLVLDVNITADTGAGDQTFQIFFSNEFGGFSEGRSRIFPVTPNVGWQRLPALDLTDTQGGKDPWQGTVDRFRIDPGSSETDLVGFRCEFDLIAITDDTDGDGIQDDAELLYWGDLDEADETTDHDDNGILDVVEIAWGMDPTVDLGETLPAASGAALLALGLCFVAMGALAVRRKRPKHSPAPSPQ